MPDTGLRSETSSIQGTHAADVVVIGLGYVGRPLALDAARAGFRVTGFDREAAAASATMAEAAANGPTGGCLAVTSDAATLPAADVWLVCVPTPLDATGQPDLSAVAAALETCRRHMAPGALVCLVSTCHPGATNGLCRRILERDGHRIGRDVFLAVSPERENPGPGAIGPRHIPRLLGAPDGASLARARAFWERVTDRVICVESAEVAECAKLLENSYRLVNIALMDELHRAFAALGVPTRAVVAAAATKPFGFAPFWPGLGAGGHCIPVDPAYLQMETRRVGVPSVLLDAALAANHARPGRVLGAIVAAFGGEVRGRRILVAGVTYKPDVPDLRGAAPVALIRGLAACGAEVAWWDPVLAETPQDLAPFPRAAALPDVGQAGAPDALVLGTPHAAVPLDRLAGLAPLVFDPFGLVAPCAAPGLRVV